MQNDFTIKRATRTGIKPLIGLFGESGTGKTMSALLLARGLVGPSGKIVMIDTESGRGSLYADVIPGGYDVLELREPFAPSRYIAAIQSAESSGAGVVVIDSASHEWEGIGGVLDIEGENESKSGRPGLHNWKAPKLEHAKFMLRLLQSRTPIIVCLRAKHKTRQGKNEHGKTEIVKDDFTTPIQAKDFIFEMTAHGEILQDHSLRLTKCSHPSLGACFPKGSPITVEHGALLAAWCADSAVKPSSSSEDLKALKSQLWTLAKPLRGEGSAEVQTHAVEKFLRTWGILAKDKTLADLTAEEISVVIEKLQIQLNEK